MRGQLSEGLADGGHGSVTGQEVGRVAATVLGEVMATAVAPTCMLFHVLRSDLCSWLRYKVMGNCGTGISLKSTITLKITCRPLDTSGVNGCHLSTLGQPKLGFSQQDE